MDWMILPLKRYADFKGRSCRREYWMFALMHVAIGILFYVPTVSASLSASADRPPVVFGVVLPLFLLYALVMAVPALAVQVRRFHDLDRSGRMILLWLVPFVGAFIVLYFMCLGGTKGPNRYGADPTSDDAIWPA